MKKTFKSVIALVLVLIMAVAMVACAPKDDGADKIVFGTSADYPPFEFIYLDDEGNQQYAGIDVFLAEKIAEDMGKELEVVNMSFENLITALGKGEMDFVIAAMEEDPERLESADASDPYYTDLPAMILVKKENADQYKTIEDFAGKSVGAQSGTTKADIVTNDMAGANLVGLTSVIDLVNELAYDKCDAIVLDGAVAMEYAEANDDFVISDVALGEALPYLVWVEKGDPKGILEDINATIKAANDEGLMDEWIAKADELSAQALEG